MNKIFCILLIGLSTFSYGQNTSISRFNGLDFLGKFETVEWLCQYDMIAWQTSDSLMTQDTNELKRLGKDWFCFQKDNEWHAVYGNYKNGLFDMVFHYIVDNKRNVKRTYEIIDTSLTHKYSRALQLANQQMKHIKDSIQLSFNQFIKENEDHTLTVWILPAFQTNNVAVYGGEFIYMIDSLGYTVLKDESHYQGKFRGFQVNKPREIWITYLEVDQPTIGAIFFTWYYKSYFTKIVIETSNSISTPFNAGNNKWTWIHAMKSAKKEKKRRRRKKKE
jgi:hypothetical protein